MADDKATATQNKDILNAIMTDGGFSSESF